LAAWMAAVPIRRAILLGNSFGCQIIAAFAVAHPDAVSHVILQGPTMDPHARTACQRLAGGGMNSFREPRVQGGPTLGAVVRRDYRDAGVRRVLGTLRGAPRAPVGVASPRDA